MRLLHFCCNMQFFFLICKPWSHFTRFCDHFGWLHIIACLYICQILCLTAVTQQCHHSFDQPQLPICYRDYARRDTKLTSMFQLSCTMHPVSLWSFISVAPTCILLRHMDFFCPLMLTRAVCFNLWPLNGSLSQIHIQKHTFSSRLALSGKLKASLRVLRQMTSLALFVFCPWGWRGERENPDTPAQETV